MRSVCLVVILSLSQLVWAQDFTEYTKQTSLLIQSKQYEEALKRLVWFYDNAPKSDPRTYLLRNKNTIEEWVNLGKIYRPALLKMREIRDKKSKQIIDEGKSFGLFFDVKVINKYLDEEERSVILFSNITDKHPKLAQDCWGLICDYAYENRRIELIKKYVPDPVIEHEKYIDLFYRMIKRYKENDKLLAQQQDSFDKATHWLVDTARLYGNVKAANTIKQNALAIRHSEAIKSLETTVIDIPKHTQWFPETARNYVIVVPKDIKNMNVGDIFPQMAGTGCAWSRTEHLPVKYIDHGEHGFDLVERQKNGKFSYSQEKFDSYLKVLKDHGVKSTWASIMGMYPLDAKTRVDWSKLDLEKYKVLLLQQIGKTDDQMISVMEVLADLTEECH